MGRFIRTENKWMSTHGQDLKRYVVMQQQYYKSVQQSPVKDKLCGLDGGNVPCKDKILEQFHAM